MKKKIIIGVRIALGIVFVGASIDKILHPADFALAVYNYQLLPDALINLTALILPCTELLLGVCLITGVWRQGALFIANLLLLIFMAALIYNLSRGLNIHCGCFSAKSGTAEGSEMVWTVLRDAVFLGMGLFLFSEEFLRSRREEAFSL